MPQRRNGQSNTGTIPVYIEYRPSNFAVAVIKQHLKIQEHESRQRQPSKQNGTEGCVSSADNEGGIKKGSDEG